MSKKDKSRKGKRGYGGREKKGDGKKKGENCPQHLLTNSTSAFHVKITETRLIRFVMFC